MKTKLAVMSLLLATATAFAEKPPPEILEIFKKMQQNKTLDDQEQAKLRTWQQSKALSAGGASTPPTGNPSTGAMPPDIAAIMEQAQRGVPPSAADREKLKAWQSQVQPHKGEIIQDEMQKRTMLEGAVPAENVPYGKFEYPFLEGEVQISQTLIATHFESCKDQPRVLVTANTITRLTGPVRFRTREPGKELAIDAKKLGESGPFSVIFEPKGAGMGSTTANVTGCDPTSGSTAIPGVMLSGELNSQPARVFVDLEGPVTTLDKYRPELVWQKTAAPNSEFMKQVPQAAAIMAALPDSMKKAIEKATFDMKGEALRKAIRERKSADVVGTYKYFVDDKEHESTQNVTIMITVRVNPAATDGMHMAVLGEDGKPSAAAWQKWMPLPWLDSAEESKFFGLEKAHDPKAGVKLGFAIDNDRKCKIHVELSKVSEHRGVTTNWPVNAKETHKSLKFPTEDKVNDDWVIAKDGQSADSKNEVSTISLQLASLDTAASGEVKARCDALKLDAVFEPTGKSTLVLPRDDNDNHVADQYEDDTGATGRNLGSDWDEDENPKPKQRRNGDGLTLFEEYRGFVARTSSSDATRKFVRTDWNTKTTFANDPDKLFEKYMLPWNAKVFRFDWLVLDDKLADLSGGESTRTYGQVNTNSPEGKAYTWAPQFLLSYERHDELPENAKAIERSIVPKGEVSFVHPTRSYYLIKVNPAKTAKMFNAEKLPKCAANIQTMQDNDNAISVMHETAHFFGVHHHQSDNIDINKPVLDKNGKVVWEEYVEEQSYGVPLCIMRYNDRWGGKDDFDDYDMTFVRKCQRPVPAPPGLCREGDKATYITHKNPRKAYDTRSDNCWGQVDVKNDPL